LLSVRGAEEEFLAGVARPDRHGWSVGFVAGSIGVPVIVRKVGHIRAFSVMAAIGTITILLNLHVDQRYQLDRAARAQRLLFRRCGDDRRELAQRGVGQPQSRHDLFDLRHHQHGRFDASASSPCR
jgi:hypothetical protein